MKYKNAWLVIMPLGMALGIAIIASVTLKPNIEHINGVLSIIGVLLGLSMCTLSYLEFRNDRQSHNK
jgi:hypothetical protein